MRCDDLVIRNAGHHGGGIGDRHSGSRIVAPTGHAMIDLLPIPFHTSPTMGKQL